MQEEPNETFSDNPIENLRIENEILKLKLKAQYGDAFQMFTGDEPLPPDVENQFLKNMILFEENYKNAAFVTILEKIGNPEFPVLESLSPEQLPVAIEKILQSLLEHDIHLDFLYKPYNEKEVYQFLTEDFLQQEIEKEVVEGTICNFIYEEFRPNHKEDLNTLTHQIVQSWVTKNIGNIKDNLAKEIIDATGKLYKESEIITKIENFFAAFESFTNDGYNIDEIAFQIKEDGDSGFGHGEGALKFDAILENGEQIYYEGPYKIYYTYQFGYWYIFYFILPGFKWDS